MSNGKEDDSVGSWSKHNRHINELQHLRQAVQVPIKYPSTTLARADSDARKRTRTADGTHKKSKSFFDASPYMVASPQPLDLETAESSFMFKREPSVKRRTRSTSSAGPSPTPSTSSSQISSVDNPSFVLSMDKNKSWLQEDNSSENTNVSPSPDRSASKRTTKDSRRKDGDKENRNPSRSQAQPKVTQSTSTDILDKVSKGDIFRLTEMTTSRSDTSKKTPSSKHGSISRSSKQRKPTEQVVAAAKQLRLPIERRYSIMADMIKEGETYNPLKVIRDRNLRENEGEADLNFLDDRYIRLLDPWYVSSDELIAHTKWRKEQATKKEQSVNVEEVDSKLDTQMKDVSSAPLTTEAFQDTSRLSFEGDKSIGLQPTITSPQRKDFISPSPSLSPLSTPPRSPNINTYPDSVYGNDEEEEDRKEFAEKRRSWSNPFSRKDKGKFKGKDTDLEAKRRHRNDEFMHHYQITPMTKPESTSQPVSTNQSNNSLPENVNPAGQTLLVPAERHGPSAGRHRRSLSTLDVPTLSSHRLATPDTLASGDSNVELSSEDTHSRISFRSRRHSFDNLPSSSTGGHRHFGIWSDKHRKSKKGGINSDSEQNDAGTDSKWRFRHILNNSDTESESNESDYREHRRSKRRDLRNMLKKETDFTNKSQSRPSSQSPPYEEAVKREPTPDVMSTGVSLETRIALQEQRLREMALYSDQEDDADMQSINDLERTHVQPPRSDESEKVSPHLGSDEPIAATRKVYLIGADLPAEVQAMVQQYEAMNRVQIVSSSSKQDSEQFEEKDNADSNLTTDADTESATISEAGTEDASVDKASEDKFDDEDEDDDEKATDGKFIVIEATENDDVQFTKLLNVDLDLPGASGILVDLHVSMLGDADQDYNSLEPVLEENIQVLNTELEKSRSLATEAKAFYEEHRHTLQELILDEAHEYGELGLSSSLSSNGSFGGLYMDKHDIIDDNHTSEEIAGTGTSSIQMSPTPSPNRSLAGSLAEFGSHSLQRAPSLLLNNVPYRSVSPFDYRQEEVRLGINALRGEMELFQQALHETENLIKGIQTDMNNTSERIPTILHDIPENDYSMLKKLEVEVDSILANRAKSPWLDTGYALLSYVLAYTAFFVWVIIRVFKWIRAVVVFPRTLWTTYSEYLVERDKAVKRASLQAVTSGFDKVPFESDSGRRHHRQHRRRRSSGVDIPKPSYTM